MRRDFRIPLSMAELVFHPCQLDVVIMNGRDQFRIKTGKGRKAKCTCVLLLHVVAPRVPDWGIMLIL